MKKRNNNLSLVLIVILLPIVIAIGGIALYMQVDAINNTTRSIELTDDKLVDGKYELGDITLIIGPRGGDASSWGKDPILDDDGNELHGSFVGTIYEADIINNTSNSIPEWSMVISIPEDMYFNNSWNGDFELHQNTMQQNAQGEERVQAIKLNDYTSYDITLDYYLDHTGPMIPMYKGDYFVYTPNPDFGEVPLGASDPAADKIFSIKIGFIVYIADQGVEYITDFGHGSFSYRMETSMFDHTLFWVLTGLVVVWLMAFSAFVVLKIKLKSLLERQKRDEEIIEQTMNTFVNFIEAKDPSTMGHSLRVARYSRLIAEKLGLPEQESRQIYYIGLMHDCGKLYIADSILTKPAKLTDEEYEEMKRHTVYGKELLKDFTSLEGIDTGAFYHHERYDGKGYPTGISGEDIPLTARIIGVCDAFDAMSSTRCYRKKLTKDKILSELIENKNKQFDGKIVDVLLKLIDDKTITLN